MATLHTLFYFTIAIAILVAFHEFGHFWVARKTGVKVLRFSIGFGKPLLSIQKTAADTQFVIAAIPLGGYVKMVDEREGAVAAHDLPKAFNRQSVWVRSAIVAAGPIANLLLAVLLFWLALAIGETGQRPVVGEVPAHTLAAEAGFQARDEIVAINEVATPTWLLALDALMSHAMQGEVDIRVAVKTVDDSAAVRQIHITDADVQSPELLQQRLGLRPWMPIIKPVLGQLQAEGAAVLAGLETGDLIVSADAVAMTQWQQWVEYVQARPDTAIQVELERNGQRISRVLTPASQEKDGKSIGKIGAGVLVDQALRDSMTVYYAMPPWEALCAAVQRTGFYAKTSVQMMGKMLVGKASVSNLSGPISIAQYAGQSADMGFTAFLKFLGLVSVSLGVLNLLPIPVLDGGHLLFFTIEAIKGSPVSEKIQGAFQQMGLALLLSLMVLAMVLDLDRLFQSFSWF